MTAPNSLVYKLRQVRPSFWVVAIAGLTLFANLGAATLFDDDEAKNAECAREMFERGDWIVPTFNYDLRPDKPILLYWLMLGSYHVFGVTEFAARFVSAVCGIGTCLLTYHIGKVLFSRQVGLWAGVMLASSLMFDAVARASTPDSTLIFLTTLSLYLFVRATAAHWRDASRQHSPLDGLDWKRFLPMYAVMALAVLAKGPVGVLLPCAVIGLFLIVDSVQREGVPGRSPAFPSGDLRPSDLQSEVPDERALQKPGFFRRLRAALARWFRLDLFWRHFRQMRTGLILLCVAIIALPWYVVVGMKTDGEWLKGFLGTHNVGRFTRTMEGHKGPVFYYLVAILAGFFPWSVFLPWAVIRLFRRLRSDAVQTRRLTFLACWFGLYVVFFTLARTKLPNYVLPCYPALALSTAWLLHDCEWTKQGAVGRLFRWAFGSLMAAGVGIGIALAILGEKLLGGSGHLGLVGVVPLAGGLAAWWCFRRDRMPAARTCLAATATVFVVALFAWVAPEISRHQNGRLVAAELKGRDRVAKIATFNYSAPGLVYYSRRQIDSCPTTGDVARFLADDGAFLVTRSDRLETLKPHLPPGAAVVHRERRFLRDHDIVVIGRPAMSANDQTAGTERNLR